MKRALVSIFAFAAGMGIVLSAAVSQPPDGGDKEGKGGGKDGPPRYELGQIFPPPLVEEMNLTPTQQRELEKIQSDLKVKLEKLLTDDQKKTVQNFRPRGPMGKGGPGGDKGGQKGDKGGQKGEKGDKGGPKGDKGAYGEKGDKPPMDKE